MLYFRDPAEPGLYPLCPLRATTGLYCPGCGTLRAAHQLLHGRVRNALSLNPVAVLAVPFAAYHLVLWLMPSLRRRLASPPLAATWVALVVAVAFGIVRNLPFEWAAWARP